MPRFREVSNNCQGSLPDSEIHKGDTSCWRTQSTWVFWKNQADYQSKRTLTKIHGNIPPRYTQSLKLRPNSKWICRLRFEVEQPEKKSQCGLAQHNQEQDFSRVDQVGFNPQGGVPLAPSIEIQGLPGRAEIKGRQFYN